MSRQRSFLVLIFTLISISVLSQEYYVVIGAFAKEDNAKKFTGYANSKFFNATYRKKPASKLFYVVVLETTNKGEAEDRAKMLRSESEFTDTWSYFGDLEDTAPVAVESQPKVIVAPPVEPVIVVEENIQPPEVMKDSTTDSTMVPTPSIPVETKVRPPAKGKYFKYTIVTSEGSTVPGQVHYVDQVRGRDLATYKANEYVDVLRPGGDNTMMTIVCGVFGYKEVEQIVDYNDPSTATGAIQESDGSWVIPFQLVRLSKGDASVMYHVSFFKDAVVMLKDSKVEMDELVSMMTLNPKIVIKVHGHCNGTASRRIIALGPTKNYFDVKGSDERKGSAKELSNLRAEAVQSYLVDNGIEKDRIKIYAWGGLNMLVDEHSPSAKLNDRIEIEILED